VIALGAIDGLLNNLAAVFGAALGLIGLNAALRDFYRRSLGRRRDRYGRLARLGTGAQLSFFEAVLGEPPAMRRTVVKQDFREYIRRGDPRFQRGGEELQEVYVEKEFTECIFIDRDYYVQVICDDDQTVLSFSVTVRGSHFHPVFQMPSKIGWRERRRWSRRTGETFEPLFRVRLGRTRFAELDRGDPEEFIGPHFKAWIGARSFSYSEDHYYGNPGYYQTFVFTAGSNARIPTGIGDLSGAIQEAGGEEWPDRERDDQPNWDQMPKAQAFRRQAIITTYTVISVNLQLDNHPSTFGPHGDEVRTLP
jgi:hypothetical protein